MLSVPLALQTGLTGGEEPKCHIVVLRSNVISKHSQN